MRKRGFTLVEIMIVVAIIALLAAIAIPNLLRARLSANQTAAQGALRTITSSMESVRSANGAYVTTPSGTTVATLAWLGPGTGNSDPPYIDNILSAANALPGKQGYLFTLAVAATPFQQYVANAIPTNHRITGENGYCTSEDGVVRVIPGQTAAPTAVTTSALCQALNPAQ